MIKAQGGWASSRIFTVASYYTHATTNFNNKALFQSQVKPTTSISSSGSRSRREGDEKMFASSRDSAIRETQWADTCASTEVNARVSKIRLILNASVEAFQRLN